MLVKAPFSDEREEVIINYLHSHKAIRVSEVTELLSISPSTARILLQKMQDQGQLTRVRGGAILNGTEKASGEYDDFLNIKNKEAKLIIAELAASTVKDGDYICLGSGTTTYLMATKLHGIQDLTVVTDSLPIANELCHDDSITVHISGGWIMKRNSACRGKAADTFFRDIRVDKAYNGADSIDLDLGTTSVDLDPRTETAICHCGKKCYILADSSKFKKRPYMDCVLKTEEIDVIITEKPLSPEKEALLQKANIKLLLP